MAAMCELPVRANQQRRRQAGNRRGEPGANHAASGQRRPPVTSTASSSRARLTALFADTVTMTKIRDPPALPRAIRVDPQTIRTSVSPLTSWNPPRPSYRIERGTLAETWLLLLPLGLARSDAVAQKHWDGLAANQLRPATRAQDAPAHPARGAPTGRRIGSIRVGQKAPHRVLEAANKAVQKAPEPRRAVYYRFGTNQRRHDGYPNVQVAVGRKNCDYH
jgi:hypothetical protein